jgi:hypothetical protein
MALALQAALYRVLLPPQPAPVRIRGSPAIIAMILKPMRRHRALGAPHGSGRSREPRPRFQSITVQPITAPRIPKAGVPPAIDWQVAIGRVARAEAARAGEQPLRFGFPRMRPHTTALPEFAWDKARIDRIQRLENGIIDLGERCVIKLPFPIPICRFGRIPANGDLFKHMHDPRRAQSALP